MLIQAVDPLRMCTALQGRDLAPPAVDWRN